LTLCIIPYTWLNNAEIYGYIGYYSLTDINTGMYYRAGGTVDRLLSDVPFSLLLRNPIANIELSEAKSTSCLLNKLIYLINRQFLCKKCLKPLMIQYLQPDKFWIYGYDDDDYYDAMTARSLDSFVMNSVY